MRFTKGCRALPALAAATIGYWPVTAFAAGPEQVASSDDIVVTAEKRETTVQRAPIAITAISGDSLKQSRIVQLSDLTGYVPGLTLAKNNGFTRVASIRGIGYETSETVISQPGVAFHQDGVYIVSAYSLQMDLLDVARMEVLRGPQSTIFGQGATGGTINAITVKPVLGKWTGDASISQSGQCTSLRCPSKVRKRMSVPGCQRKTAMQDAWWE